MKAGPRAIGVAFIERDEVRDEEVLRPRLRSPGPEIAIETVTISGPYQPERTRRHAVAAAHFCMPARLGFPGSASEEEPCARRILSALERRAYRRPVTAEDVEPA